MGFFRNEKPKPTIIDLLNDHQWEVALAVGVLLFLALLLYHCVFSDNKVPRTRSMDGLDLPYESSGDEEEDDDEEEEEDDDDDEEEIVTPRRSARIRNKRLSLTV